MSPFLTVGAVGEYDVKSEVIGGGHSGERFKPSLHEQFLCGNF